MDRSVPRYAVALLVVLLATACRLLLDPFVGDQIPYATYFIAVMITAWLSGLGPALLSVALSALAAILLFVPPRHVFEIEGLGNQVGFAVFLFVGSATAILSERMRRARRQADGSLAEARHQQQLLQREIAERQRIEDELCRQREWFRVAFASIADAVVATDIHGAVSLLNPTAERLTGWTFPEAQGVSIDKVLRIIDADTRQPLGDSAGEAFRKGAAIEVGATAILVSKQGLEHAVDARAAPIRDAAGTIIGAVLIFRDVSDKRRLDAAQGRLAALVTSAEDAIIGQTFDSIVTSWSAGAEQLYGYRAEEVIGMPLCGTIVPQEQATEFLSILERVKRGERIAALETTRIRKDGRRLDVWIRISPIQDADGVITGASIIDRDMSQAKAAERRRNVRLAVTQILAREESIDEAAPRILQAMCDTFGWAVGCFWHCDEQTDMLQCRYSFSRSPAEFAPFESACREHVISVGPALPRQVWHVRKPIWIADVTRDPQFLRALAAKATGLHGALAFPVAVGPAFLGTIEFFAHEIEEPDVDLLELLSTVGGQVGLFIQRKQAEEGLREASRRKDEFLATLAHELRNPLAPIRNAVQIMRLRGLDDPDLLAAHQIIDRQVQQMSRLIDDLLDISRISRGMVELRREVIDLQTVVQRSIESTQPLIDERQHELIVDLTEQPLSIDGDPTRLEQILSNLLNNAAKYTEPGGRIWLTASHENGHAQVSVRDSGIGMSADFLPRAFDIFIQAQSKSTSKGGLGIGLSLVRQLTEMHGGSVTAFSAGLGKGSEFVLRLPVTGAVTSARAPAAPQQAEMPATRGRRVLVVDDNVDAAQSLAMLLNLDGHEVQVAHDGRSALETAAADPPEFIFLDIGLPGIDGYEVARRLRKQFGKNHFVLIALTGWGQEDDRRRSKEAGFDFHFVKPVEPDELRSILSRPTVAGQLDSFHKAHVVDQ